MAFEKVVGPDGYASRPTRWVEEQVFPAKVGQVAKDMLRQVVTSGTGEAAQVGDEVIWGKTGTTENYGDAWFAGGNDDLDGRRLGRLRRPDSPMEFEHAGGPVAGGTFPAEIFHDFMTSALGHPRSQRDLASGKADDEDEESTPPATPVTPSQLPSAEQSAPGETAPAEQAPADEDGRDRRPEHAQPQPAPEPAPAPAPAPTQLRPGHPAERRRGNWRRSGLRGGAGTSAPC